MHPRRRAVSPLDLNWCWCLNVTEPEILLFLNSIHFIYYRASDKLSLVHLLSNSSSTAIGQSDRQAATVSQPWTTAVAIEYLENIIPGQQLVWHRFNAVRNPLPYPTMHTAGEFLLGVRNPPFFSQSNSDY